MTMRLLIAEDEVDLAEALTVFLRKNIFRRTPSTTGETIAFTAQLR